MRLSSLYESQGCSVTSVVLQPAIEMRLNYGFSILGHRRVQGKRRENEVCAEWTIDLALANLSPSRESEMARSASLLRFEA